MVCPAPHMTKCVGRRWWGHHHHHEGLEQNSGGRHPPSCKAAADAGVSFKDEIRAGEQ